MLESTRKAITPPGSNKFGNLVNVLEIQRASLVEDNSTLQLSR
jgi:hypothetical protein